jgi:RNA polymerase sigma-70 factor (ECF subfamily)
LNLSRPAPRGHGEPEPGDVAKTADAILAHLDSAYNLARWLVRRDGDAQDVVQEAYLRALRSIATYRGGGTRGWILAIVRNTCFDWLRKARALETEEADADQRDLAAACDDAEPSHILQRAEDARAVRRAVEALPPEFRQVVVLREMEGLSYKEIAAVAGVPIGTVMSRLARARRRLARVLSGERELIAGEADA